MENTPEAHADILVNNQFNQLDQKFMFFTMIASELSEVEDPDNQEFICEPEYSFALQKFKVLLKGDVPITPENACKLAVWGFDPKSFKNDRQKNPLYKKKILEEVPLPLNGSLHLKKWQQWIQESKDVSDKLIKAFSLMNVFPIKTKEEAIRVGSAIETYGFTTIRNNYSTAMFALKHKIKNDTLSQYLKFKINEEINLPNPSEVFCIQENIKYTLIRLHRTDPAIMIIGESTDCCLRFGGHAERCLEDGLTLPNNGFYVLLKTVKAENDESFQNPCKHSLIYFEAGTAIVGVGYAYLTKQGNLMIDSWENQGKSKENEHLKYNNIAKLLLLHFSQQIFDTTGLGRIVIGKGGKTPHFWKLNSELLLHEIMLEGFNYGDGKTQSLIQESNLLFITKENLKVIVAQTFPSDYLISHKFCRSWGCLTAEDIRELKEINNLINAEERLRKALIICQGEENPTVERLCDLTRLQNTENEHIFNKRTLWMMQGQFCTLEQLSNIQDKNEIHVLTNEDLLSLYAHQNVSFEDLLQFKSENDRRKREVLLSKDAIEAYSDRYLEFQTLNQIPDIEIIRLLTSYDARTLYKKGCLATDLQAFFKDKSFETCREYVELLGSQQSSQALNLGAQAKLLLKLFEHDTLAYESTVSKLVSPNAQRFFHNEFAINEIINKYFTNLKLFELILNKVDCDIFFYLMENMYVRIEDMESVNDMKKLEILISEAAKHAYTSGQVTFDRLKTIDNRDKLIILISKDVRQLYSKAAFSEIERIYAIFECLSANDVRKVQSLFRALAKVKSSEALNALTSPEAQKAIQAGAPLHLLLKLFENDKQTFSFMTSAEAVAQYNEGLTFEKVRADYQQK